MSRRRSATPGYDPHRVLQLSNDRLKWAVRARFPRHQHQLNSWGKSLPGLTIRLSKPPPQPVAAHCASNLPAHRKPDFPRRPPRAPQKEDAATLDSLAVPKDRLELPAPPEPFRPRNPTVAHRRTPAISRKQSDVSGPSLGGA